MDGILASVRAAGDQTRLRLIGVLSHCELTVSELCQVLGQSQPRISRHLKLMCEAGLLKGKISILIFKKIVKTNFFKN